MLGFLAGVMFFVAAVLVYFAVGALSNLWADYQDSPASTYIAAGGADLIGAAAAVTVGVWMMREHGRQDR
ncbi:MAG: hypothetical protein R2718_13140 [Solirubrobacterales bacterium]|nr:hypothetical protein [Solirubrobacterales bacterium]